MGASLLVIFNGLRLLGGAAAELSHTQIDLRRVRARLRPVRELLSR